MRTYKLIIAYDGTGYQGWQRQSGTDKTIQGMLERALEQTVGYAVEINGSGRTDGGVHAKGQTASLVLPGKIDEEVFRTSLNDLLPEDIRICNVKLVKNGFHARYSARGKCYEYYVDCRQKPDVFRRRYSCHYPGKLNLPEMEKAAAYLTGTHDFRGFTDKKEEISTVRTIYDIILEEQNDLIRIEYYGNGFLYHMVRILTGTLLETGSGQKSADDVRKALEDKQRMQTGFLAPAKGLFLKEVYY